MAEFINVKEEQKIVSSLPIDIRLGEKLENENILIFEESFAFLEEGKKLFKNLIDNISVDLKNHKYSRGNNEKQISTQIKSFFSDSCHQLQTFICEKFSFYDSYLEPFVAKFVPSCEKKQQDLPLLLHHFSLHPVNGERILTFYINIDAENSMHFLTSKISFNTIANTIVKQHKIPLPPRRKESLKWKIENKIRSFSKKMGLNLFCTSPYDIFMFRLYSFLERKKDFHDHEDIHKYSIKLNQSCLFFSDAIPHNIETGCSHLVFSYILPRYSLLNPEKAPISILERISKEVMKEAKMAYFQKEKI